jgi:hypothetical protein
MIMENGPLGTTTCEKPLATQEGRDWLKSHLKMGPVYVTFTKKDGTERKMKCTLQEGVVVPHEKTTERVKEENTETLAVWDMEKNAWRSFRLDTVNTIEFGIE